MPTLDPSLSRVGGQSPYSFSLTRDKRENLVWREDSVLFSWNQDLSGREKQTVSLNSLHGSHSTTAAWLCFLTCPLGKLRLPHTDFRVAYKQHVGSCSEVRTFLRVGYSIFSLDCKGCCSGLIAEKYCKKQDAHEGTNWRLLSLAGIERCQFSVPTHMRYQGSQCYYLSDFKSDQGVNILLLNHDSRFCFP